MIRNEVRMTVYSYEMAKEVSELAEAMGCKVYVHIKLDTGMARLGFQITEENAEEILGDVSGIIVPGGFGDRGTDGMITSIKYAREHNIPADCVLNMLMIDGIGICGVCRVMIGGVQKQTCIDGPVFNAWDVDFDYILNRQRSFV